MQFWKVFQNCVSQKVAESWKRLLAFLKDMKSLENLKSDFKVRSTSLSAATNFDEAVKIRLRERGLAAVRPVTVPDFFREFSKCYASEPALAFKSPWIKDLLGDSNGNNWNILSYENYAAKVQHMAKLLIHIGLQPRKAVGIMANNCPEWLFMLFGVIQAGGIVFGIPSTSSSEEVRHRMTITKATICVVKNAEQFTKLQKCGCLPNVKLILQLNGSKMDFKSSRIKYFCLIDLMKRSFDKTFNEELKKREGMQCANECAMVAFTSGSTGTSKAVMLSHDNLIFSVKATFRSQSNISWGEERIVSYLPLSHLSVQIFDIFAALLTGACVYFAEPNALKGSLVRTLQEVKPTVFVGVPQIYEKLQERLKVENRQKGNFTKYIESSALDTVTQNNLCEVSCSTSIGIKDTFANYIIDNKRKVIGMESCKIFFCLGGRLESETKEFFKCYDVSITDVYSLPELSGVVTLNRSTSKVKSLGKPIDGTELHVKKPNEKTKSGDILVRGRHVFMGYLDDPAGTAAAINNDGWFITGEMGYVNCEGCLYIADSRKIIIKMAGGKRVAPEPIEKELKRKLNALNNVMVVGDKRKYLTVLLTLKKEIDPSTGLQTDNLHADTKSWLRSLNLNIAKFSSLLVILKEGRKSEMSSRITQSIMTALEDVNKQSLNNSQRLRKFLLLRNDFSVATGELDRNLKTRRSFILKKYAKNIDQMYG